jgi:hypothetical protein
MFGKLDTLVIHADDDVIHHLSSSERDILMAEVDPHGNNTPRVIGAGRGKD